MADQSAILFNESKRVVACAPFPVSLDWILVDLAWSPVRATLSRNLFKWLSSLRGLVFIERLWFGGSYFEHVEEPRDIDVVVYFRYLEEFPSPLEQNRFISQNAAVFSPAGARSVGIDAAFVRLCGNPVDLVQTAARWTLLLTHNGAGLPKPFYSVCGCRLDVSEAASSGCDRL